MSTPPRTGEVLFRWEPPDLISFGYVGDITAELVREGEVRAWEYVREKRYFLSIVDISRMGSLSADGRWALAHPEHHFPVRGVAVVGASFHFRALASFAVRALALLQRQVDNPLRFFRTDDEARCWIDARRKELLVLGIRPDE